MTDVQVSNARRFGFTALAIASFFVCYLSSYWWLVDQNYEYVANSAWMVGWWQTSWGLFFRDSTALQLIVIGLSIGALPMLFLSLSVSNSPASLRGHVIWSTILLCGCGAWSWVIGSQDFDAVFVAFSEPTRVDTALRREMRASHEVSWFSLLVPLILTTALVIFGAWRRAVRDAEVDAVGEGE